MLNIDEVIATQKHVMPFHQGQYFSQKTENLVEECLVKINWQYVWYDCREETNK